MQQEGEWNISTLRFTRWMEGKGNQTASVCFLALTWLMFSALHTEVPWLSWTVSEPFSHALMKTILHRKPLSISCAFGALSASGKNVELKGESHFIVTSARTKWLVNKVFGWSSTPSGEQGDFIDYLSLIVMQHIITSLRYTGFKRPK